MTIRSIDLEPYLNARVATFENNRPAGELNAWGNAFPAEELPFGSTLAIGPVVFRLPEKAGNDYDSVEPLGQVIEIAPGPPAGGLAFLCCGEMGEQHLPIRVTAPGRDPVELAAVAKGVMVTPRLDVGDEGFVCSRLCYPGDYDLALALPALWCFQHRWEEPCSPTRLEVGTNPLFHLVAVTLLDADQDHA